jgi:cell pole-organizing protein PopZ
MSAASPKTQDKAAEPSMEEILASIRRIIADDQAVKPEATPVRSAPPLPENDDVLDLAEVAEPVRKLEAAPQPIEPEPIDFGDEALDFDAIEVEPEPEPVFEPPPRAVIAPEPRREPPTAELHDPFLDAPVERLTSTTTDASVNQAFSMLAHTVLSQNSRTLEDLVKDMLRPMLKAWLDDNLPTMVERLVRAEIERVSRGR